MSYGRENVVYDFSRFEQKEPAPKNTPPENKKAKAVVKANTAVKPKLKPLSVIKWAFMSGLVMASLIAVMSSNVMLNELNQEITNAQKNLSASKSDYVALNMKLEGRMSLLNVEDYASNHLGMQQISQYQIQYISLTDKDKVDVIKNHDNDFSNSIRNLFNSFLEYFR